MASIFHGLLHQGIASVCLDNILVDFRIDQHTAITIVANKGGKVLNLLRILHQAKPTWGKHFIDPFGNKEFDAIDIVDIGNVKEQVIPLSSDVSGSGFERNHVK